MSQTKLQSLSETSVNMAIGSVISWMIVYFCMKYIVPLELATTVSVVLCTVASFARGYIVRCNFNRMTSK